MARHLHRRLTVKMTADLAPRSLLDVGCGEVLAAFAALALLFYKPARMSGIEISANAVALAKQRFPSATFFVQRYRGWRTRRNLRPCGLAPMWLSTSPTIRRRYAIWQRCAHPAATWSW